MLKSCSKCGRIHDSKEQCQIKYMTSIHHRDEKIQKFRNSQKWRNCREDIKRRDKYICVYCYYNKKAKRRFNWINLSVHHIVPLEEDFERRLDESNLITLCRDDHELAEKGEISRERLQELIEMTSPRVY